MSIKKEIRDIERFVGKIGKSIGKDIKYAENWMYERKKFFIKLSLIVIVVGFLLLISNLFLKVSGVGI